MALLDADSYDYYATGNIIQVYDAVDAAGLAAGRIAIAKGFGRCGTNALKVWANPGNIGVVRGVPASGTTVIFHAAIYIIPGPGSCPVLTIESGLVPVFDLFRNIDGSFTGRSNPDAAFPPVAFTTVGGLHQGNIWCQVGMKLVLAASGGGSVTFQINGGTPVTLTGLSTLSSGDSGAWTGIHLGGSTITSSGQIWFDDFVLMDASGGAPWNDLLGDVQVIRLRPVAPGDLTQFSVTGAPTNWQAIDDGDSPDITSYIEGSAAGITDSYTWETLPSVAGTVIYGVKESALCYKDVAGGRTLMFLTRNGGVTYPEGTALAIPTGVGNYAYIKKAMMLDPKTGAQWAGAAAINASQFGQKIDT